MTPLGFIFALIGFLFSFQGIFVWGLGFIAFLIAPLGSRHAANLHLWLMAFTLQRFSIVVTEHNDLLLKQMRFIDLGVERMSFTEGDKDFEDPAAALSHWMGYPFSFADEESGVLFDPRHAAIGHRKYEYRQKDLGAVPATTSEWEANDILKWVPGVFELPKHAYELVNLRSIRELIDGGERPEYPDRIEKMYKLSRDPFTSRESIVRLALPVLAFIGVFAGLGFLKQQLGGVESGTTISFGAALLVAGLQHLNTDDINVWGILKTIAGIAIILVAFLGIATITTPAFAIIIAFVFLLGFLFMPFLAFIARASDRLSGFLGRSVFLKLGLLGYSTPVLTWTPTGYQLREATDLDDMEVHRWYSLAGVKFGVSYEPGADSFGPDVVDRTRLESGTEITTDGGSSNIPVGFERNTALQRDQYGTYVPTKLDDDTLYLNAGMAMGRMTNAALGEKSQRRLLQSKEEYGDGSGLGVSDKALLYATLTSTLLAGGLGVFIFWL